MPEISLTEDQYARLEAVKGDVEDAFVDTYGQARITDAVQYLLDTYTPPDEQGGDDTAAYERIATAEYPALQHVASDVPEVPGSGIDADEMRGKLLAELGAETFAAKLDEVDTEAAEDDGEGDAEADTDDDSADAAEVDTDGDAAAAEAADADDGPDSAGSAGPDAADAGGSQPGTQPGATSSSGDSGTTAGVRVETAGSTGSQPGAGSSGGGGGDGNQSGGPASGPSGTETTASGSTADDTGSGETTSTPGSGDAGGLLSAANRLLDEHEDKWREGDGDAPYEVDLPDGSTESARTKDDVRQLLFRHY